MTNTLQTNYRNADLRVEVVSGEARLFINNMPRDVGRLPEPGRSLRLSSTVQTDYEWHEFVEAVLTRDESSAFVELSANNVLLLSESLDGQSCN